MVGYFRQMIESHWNAIYNILCIEYIANEIEERDWWSSWAGRGSISQDKAWLGRYHWCSRLWYAPQGRSSQGRVPEAQRRSWSRCCCRQSLFRFVGTWILASAHCQSQSAGAAEIRSSFFGRISYSAAGWAERAPWKAALKRNCCHLL